MLTIKPISTISYNSENFLHLTLKKLNAKFYCFIHHKKEEDETKDHYHLYAEFYDKVDLQKLRQYFFEYTRIDLKPLGCLPFRTSKTEDFILYSLHDKEYLSSKGQTRKHHYKITDFITSDFDYLNELYNSINRTKFNSRSFLFECAENGLTWTQVVFDYNIPIQQYRQYKEFYELISREISFRNDYEKNH